MKKLQLFITTLLLGPIGWHSVTAQTLDPSFAPNSVYTSGLVYSALEQPDGKRVVSGIFNRLNGASAPTLLRFNPDGSLDAAFQQNLGPVTGRYRISLLSNGQLMLISEAGSSITAGGITRQGLLRLNADGTGDATFDAGSGITGASGVIMEDVLSLPNGQLVVIGQFDHFNGVAANGIVRLTAAGAIDPTFNSGQGFGPGEDPERIAPLPGGKMLIGGFITSYNGTTRNALVRLNADGSLDPAFASSLDSFSSADNILVQPDGKILINGGLDFINGPSDRGVARLLPNGNLDNTFNPPAALTGYTVYTYSSANALQLQPDGKIIVMSTLTPAKNGIPGLVRLNADGTLDPAFQVGTGPNTLSRCVVLLASGKILVGGEFTNFSGVLDRPLIQLTSTGAIDPTFQPLIQSTGLITAVVRQSDGKFVVGGNFSEINGQPVRRLARFNADGTRDASYVGTAGDFTVIDLAQQPDGRLLVAVPGLVARLQAGGSPDNSFTASLDGSRLTALLLQPDGRVLVGGQQLYSNGNLVTQGLLRLLPDGSRDASFAPNGAGANRLTAFSAMALQPNGKIIVAGRYIPVGSTSTTGNRTVVRLEATGAIDASFAAGTFTASFNQFANSLAVQPDSKVLVGGLFSAVGGVARTSLARLNADGTLDAGFTPPTISGTVNTLLLQPNTRVLVGGSFSAPGLPNNLARLTSTGAADASFAASAVPNSAVRSLLVQPDGAIVLGGSFTSLSNTPIHALARITAPNVLQVAAPQAVAARTAAWPVPAHTALHVAPDPGAHAQTLELLDLTGRSVRQQALTGTPEAVLPVQELPAGLYLLRVTYAEGTVTRRIQVQ